MDRGTAGPSGAARSIGTKPVKKSTRGRRVKNARPPTKTNGGEGGIRTHGPVARSTVFETAPFDRSGTSPVVSAFEIDGGESGIRTHGRVSPTHAFQACSLSHSDISPDLSKL